MVLESGRQGDRERKNKEGERENENEMKLGGNRGRVDLGSTGVGN